MSLFSYTYVNGHLIARVFGIKLAFNLSGNIIAARFFNNKLFMVYPNGKSREIFFAPRGINIKFKGKNSTIKLYKHSRYRKVTVEAYNNVSVEILKTKTLGIARTTFELLDDAKLFIDENFSMAGGFVTVGVNTSLKIGKDCMFSNDIVIRTHDGHVIMDGNTGNVVNKPKDVIIGNHVWLAKLVTVLKGVRIPDGCIAATNAVVTSSVDEPGVIIAGIPAKIVKRNIKWHI